MKNYFSFTKQFVIDNSLHFSIFSLIIKVSNLFIRCWIGHQKSKSFSKLLRIFLHLFSYISRHPRYLQLHCYPSFQSLAKVLNQSLVMTLLSLHFQHFQNLSAVMFSGTRLFFSELLQIVTKLFKRIVFIILCNCLIYLRFFSFLETIDDVYLADFVPC